MEKSKIQSKKAFFIALRVLKKRCDILQKRVFELEKENVRLSAQNRLVDDSGKSTEAVSSNTQPSPLVFNTLAEINLKNRLHLTSIENQELWKELTELNQSVNRRGALAVSREKEENQFFTKEEYASLSKRETTAYTDTQQTVERSPLIRSKTFTQYEPHLTFHQNAMEAFKSSTEDLDEISLKMIDSLTLDTHEDVGDFDTLFPDVLDVDCSESVSESLCLTTDDLPDSSLESKLHENINKVKDAKSIASDQYKALEIILGQLEKIKLERSQSGDDLNEEKVMTTNKWTSTENLNDSDLGSFDMLGGRCNVCPMCNQVFDHKLGFDCFQEHVTLHFLEGETE